jgi:hypothetical protein
MAVPDFQSLTLSFRGNSAMGLNMPARIFGRLSLSVTKLKRANIKTVLWLTRIAGVVIVIAVLGFFVTAVIERSVGPVTMGLVTITFGVVIVSIHAPSPERLEYKLLRLRRRSRVKMP